MKRYEIRHSCSSNHVTPKIYKSSIKYCKSVGKRKICYFLVHFLDAFSSRSHLLYVYQKVVKLPHEIPNITIWEEYALSKIEITYFE